MTKIKDLTKEHLAQIEQLAKDLINFLQDLSDKSRIGDWTYIQPIISIVKDNKEEMHSCVFENKDKKKFQFQIWLTSGGMKKSGDYEYIPFRWYISVLNKVSGKTIHHISLPDSKNLTLVDKHLSILNENFKNIKKNSIKQEITIINNSDSNWQENTIEKILEHEIIRETLHKNNQDNLISNGHS